MALINRKAQGLKPSETFAVKAKAESLRAQGRKVFDLSAGEPEIDTPEHIKEAARTALSQGKTKYTAVNGIKELREAVAAKLKHENNISLSADEVIITNGGKQALQSLFEVVLEAGDEVIIPAPYWVSYPPMVELAGGRPVIVRPSARGSLKLSPEDLARAITPKTKWLVMNSPSNPSGAAYSRQELRAFAEIIGGTSIMVVSDEVYEKLTYGGFKFASFADACPELASRTVTVNSFSKSYAMTGWRVGYAAGPKEIISAMGRLQSQTTSNVNTMAQYAAIAALTGPLDFLDTVRKSYERRLARSIELIKKIPGLSVGGMPEGAFYLFIGVLPELAAKLPGAGSPGSRLVSFILDRAGVAAVPGDAFGEENSFRISVSSSDELIEAAIVGMGEALGEL